MKNNANSWTPNDELEVEFKNEYILIRNSSNLMVLAVTNEPDLDEQNFEEGKNEQLWTREDSNTDGFFTLKNLKVQKYLTAVSESTLQVRGKYAMHNTSSYYSLGRVLLAEHVARIFLRHNYEYDLKIICKIWYWHQMILIPSFFFVMKTSKIVIWIFVNTSFIIPIYC